MTIDAKKVKIGDVFELNSGIRLVAVPARADKLDIDMNHDEQVYDKQLVCALKKCSDENRDKPTLPRLQEIQQMGDAIKRINYG